VATGAIRVLHIPSRYQYADIFTKGLPTSLFDEFRTRSFVHLPLQLRGAVNSLYGSWPSLYLYVTRLGPLCILYMYPIVFISININEYTFTVLKTQDRNLSGRIIPDVLRQTIKDYYLVWAHDCNDYWKSLRSLCRTNMFSVKAIGDQSKMRREKVAEMMDFLEQKQGKVVRVEEVVFTTMFNTMSNILFSKDFLNLNDEHGTAHWLKLALQKTLQSAMTPNVSDLFPVLRGLDIQGLRKDYVKHLNEISSFTDKIIDERRERNSTGAMEALVEEEKDFLDHMLENNMTNAQINILVLEIPLCIQFTYT
ncbi:cytochrome P450, partial [Tanacetum coccineum]